MVKLRYLPAEGNVVSESEHPTLRAAAQAAWEAMTSDLRASGRIGVVRIEAPGGDVYSDDDVVDILKGWEEPEE